MKRFIHCSSAPLVLAALLVTADAAAVNVVPNQNQITSFLGDQGGVLVFVDLADGEKLKVIDLNNASLTISTLDNGVCRDPRISLDGTRVAYGIDGRIYARYLSGGNKVEIANVGTARSKGVGYWYRDSGEDYIVYCDSTEKYGYQNGATYRQKIRDGIVPDGARVQIHNRAYDGGITPDGVWIGEAYGDRHAYNLSTSVEYGSFYKAGGGLEGQCCNASMAPQNGTYRMTTLVIPHDYFRTWEFTGSRWQEYKTYTKPSGHTEWQRPEWSLHPNYITVVANDSSGYDLFFQKVEDTGSRIKVLNGNIGHSHLFVGDTVQPVRIDSFSASPESIIIGESSTLSWEISDATSATIEPTIGSIADIDSQTVSPSTTTTYTLTAEGGGGPVTQTATVTVTAGPTLELDPLSLSFGAVAGAADPAAQSVDVGNGEGGTLDTVTTSVQYQSGAGWLEVSGAGSGNSQTVAVQPRISGLAAGSYSASISVGCGNADNAPLSIGVALNVGATASLDRIVMTPASAIIAVNTSVELSAQALDQYGAPIATTFTWSVDGGGMVAPSSSGSSVTQHSATFTSSGSEGLFAVRVESGSVYAESAVTVQSTPPLHRLINCGSNSYDVNGWERDDPIVSGGSDWVNDQVVSTDGVPFAAPARLYRSVRHHDNTYPRFTLIGVPDGEYTVRLHLADKYNNGRRINLNIEGVPVLHDYDISGDAGGVNRAVVKQAHVNINDGNGIALQLGAVEGDAFLAGFEVLQGAFVDVEDPDVVVATPDSGLEVNGRFDLAGFAHDNGAIAEVSLSVDGNAAGVASGSSAWTAELDASAWMPGPHQVEIVATDRSGNTGSATITVVVPGAYDAGLHQDDGSTAADVGVDATTVGVDAAAIGVDAAVPGVDAAAIGGDAGEPDSANLVPAIHIIEPSAGTVWPANSQQYIQWSTVGIDDVTIRYSTDNGATFAEIAPTVYVTEAEWGNYPWQVPDVQSAECLILIVGYYGEVPTQSALFQIGEVGDGGTSATADAGTGADSAKANADQDLGGGWVCSGLAAGDAGKSLALFVVTVACALLRQRRLKYRDI